ncbi:MAG: D-alanyl-D-alanine dipeptidase [SAR324 cluster bacterium]|uniref:D-alanyl-D-alanine dipeptidase n=1 Tax=SAR324 cluster bacterium TaxID=2024889 RepID=A0A2A4SSY2_9DELT|nr:MAG: D-alanyl-D-alanine dipeptidase [SAR324 cluster bacterium]
MAVIVNQKIEYRKILIAAPEVQAIPVFDCNEPLVEMKECYLTQATKAALRISKSTLVRETVREKLQEAQQLLPKGLQIRLYEGYRSLEQQEIEFCEKLAIVQKDNPELSPEEAFIETTKLVSPIHNLDGSTNIPPHSTGAAVDIEIIDNQGTLLDFGMEIENWAVVTPSLCETGCKEISSEAQTNRDLLFQVMTRVGFVNYYTEWWHFSYGDKYWAFQLRQKNAIYGCYN